MTVERVPLDWLRDRLGHVTVVDLRPNEVYARSHVKIPGAMHVDPDSIRSGGLECVPPGRPVVTYCT